MTYGRMPLFPPCCTPRNCLHMPLFDSCCSNSCCQSTCCRPNREECQCVRIQNPSCPGEFADVELCVDTDGNLSICVRRPQPSLCTCPPRPRRRKSHCDCC